MLILLPISVVALGLGTLAFKWRYATSAAQARSGST